MKVLVVTDTFFPRYDGITRFIKEVIPGLKKDFKLTIITASYSKGKVWEGIKTIRFPVFKLVKVLDYSATMPNPFIVWREVKKADVVFVQSITHAWSVPMAILFGYLQRKKVVCYFHQMGWEQVYIHYQKILGKKIARFIESIIKAITKVFGNMCTLIIVPSESIIDVLNKIGIKTDTKIVRLGVNIREFKPPKKKELAKKKVGIHKRLFVVGYCGRISHDKDIETLLTAFDKFKENKNAILLLVGDGGKFRKLQKRKDIMMTGFVKDVADYYRAMDVFVLPSLTETTGLVTPEAMACGVPVIVTPFGFALTHISKGYNGLLFGAKEVDALVEQLEKVYKDKKLRSTLGKNGRKTVLEDFTWKKTIREIKSILKNI